VEAAYVIEPDPDPPHVTIELALRDGRRADLRIMLAEPPGQMTRLCMPD
jgi:hypothetical protein